jgi:hypothetical protein
MLRTAALTALALVSLSAARSETPLVPFVSPWNEPLGAPASLASMSPAPAGSKGFLAVSPDGHFQVGGERVRFLGVNITSGSCFAPPEFAELAAARLASFGVNSVRFHHMDADWNKLPLLDYPSGSSRALNREAFARLHHFVKALKEHGIYSDINLLVSRHFTEADGFPAEIQVLGWKDQHVLGFFNEHARELQKEYARLLLTTPGPAGTPAFAQEPAVGFVEIQNENGIIQKWYEGVLDSLPTPFRVQLNQKWLSWLRKNYPNSQALSKAWGGREEPAGAALVTLGSGSDTPTWRLDATLKVEVRDGEVTRVGNDHQVITFTIKAVDPTQWEQARLRARDVTLTPGKLYTLSFAAISNRNVGIHANLTDANGNATRILAGKVGQGWARYVSTFVAPSMEGKASVSIGGFNIPGEYTLSDITLAEGGRLVGLDRGMTLESGTIPNLPSLTNSQPTFTVEAKQDWIRFLLETERTYWKEMSDFVKNDLGFKGVVFGTIVSNSPAGVQGQLDSVDGHCYWAHPRFPAGDWDPANWLVPAESMVTDPSGSTIAQLAGQRVKGKPFTVTEYQHSSPNPYASESPLFAAAYGALQDWDGIWFFEYTLPETNKAVAEYAGRMSSFFDDGQHPTRMANYLLAANIFRRGDASPANQVVSVPFTAAQELDVLEKRGGPWRMTDAGLAGQPPLIALEHRLELDLGAKQTEFTPVKPGKGIYTSDTKEIVWDATKASNAYVQVVSPKTRAAWGFLGGRSLQLGDVRITLQPTRDGWASVGVTVSEGAFEGGEASRGIVVASALAENTNQHWQDEKRTRLGTQWGDAPSRIEVVQGEVQLPVPAARVSAFALDAHGKRGATISVTEKDGHAVLHLGEAPSAETIWYEFSIAAQQ